MKKIFFFLPLILLIQSCNKKEDHNYLTFIAAGTVDGIGIRHVDVVPDDELIIDQYGDTTRYLDLDNDGIDDFELIHFYEHEMQGMSTEMLEIKPLGTNSVCVSKMKTDFVDRSDYWVDSLKYNDTIDVNNNWSDSTALLYFCGGHQMSPYGWEEDIQGYWYNNDSLYIGVRILKGNHELFGWIDMKKNTLRQYATTIPY